MSANPVRWRATANGFVFDGLPSTTMPSQWLGTDVRAVGPAMVLGPEPIIGAQRVALVSLSQPSRSLTIATDGVRPFAILAETASNPGTP